MLEDIKAEDVASFITAASAAKKAGKKKFSIGGKSYPVTIGKALEQRVAEMSEDDIIELNDKKKSKYLTAMKARLNKEDTGISIARKMMQITSMRHLAETIAEMEIITPDELQSIVSEDLKIAARSLFLEDMIPLDRQIALDRRSEVKIIRTKDNKFQVQRMIKGKFVNQGKPYKSLKQAEKERSTGQSSMQFESEISWDFDGVMVRITRNNFDNLDEDMKNNTVNAETVSVDGVHMPVLFVAETRQMKDAKNEIMVQLKGKVKVIDKKDEKKYLAMGYTLAECMELQIEAASPEKIMKDIAALEKMLTKFGGNSSAVKMKKVALERKIAKLEKELEGMEEDATVAAFLDMLNEYGYGKKKMKDEELSPKQKKIDKNKNGKIDGSDLASLRKEGADDYKDHMMYDPKTGKGRMTTSYEDHLDLKDKGWGHEKPTKESVNPYESLYGKPLDERKLTWKDWEKQGNDAWMSREKRKDNPYKKKGQARTSWFDGWDNMQKDSDAGDFDESYGKPLDEVRGNSGPVTVNKKKYSWGNMITVNHGTSVSYPLHPKHQLKIKNLKDGESINFTDETGEKVAAKRVGDKVHLRQGGVNAKTTVDYKHFNESYGKMNASKMSSKEKAKARALAKADKDAQPKDKVSLKKAPWDKKMKEDFVKQMNIIVEGGELEQSIEESMSPKQIDMLKKSYESLRGKKISVENGMKLSKTLEKLDKESAIAVAKADIPFMSNLAMNKLIMNFGMSGADIKKAMKESVELGESAGDMEKAAAELEAYAKKYGGMDKNTFMRVANLLKTGHPDKLKSYVNNMDTDPREYVAMLLKKHIGKKSTEKMMDIKFRGESISWEDAETLRAAGVKLDEISSDMKKRYDKAALKDRDQQKNTLKRADDVGSKVVDGAVTDKASPSQTNSRFAKLDKIKQKANRKLANRRKGLATPGKGSTTKVKDHFGMAEEISGTGYELYHKTLGSAIDTAITHAKLKFGIDITPDERMEVVGMGPRKPSNGKTNTYRLMGNKGKAIQVQVYNRGGSRPYELNMYKE